MRDLGAGAFASDWTRSHANFFRAVEIEKRVMFIILTLIVAVAAFNIVSTLVMVVTDKQADIAILRTLGRVAGLDHADLHRAGRADRRHRHPGGRRTWACCSGCNVDMVVPVIERLLGFQFLAKDVYYISDLPSDVQLRDV